MQEKVIFLDDDDEEVVQRNKRKSLGCRGKAAMTIDLTDEGYAGPVKRPLLTGGGKCGSTVIAIDDDENRSSVSSATKKKKPQDTPSASGTGVDFKSVMAEAPSDAAARECPICLEEIKSSAATR